PREPRRASVVPVLRRGLPAGADRGGPPRRGALAGTPPPAVVLGSGARPRRDRPGPQRVARRRGTRGVAGAAQAVVGSAAMAQLEFDEAVARQLDKAYRSRDVMRRRSLVQA